MAERNTDDGDDDNDIMMRKEHEGYVKENP